LRKVSFDKAIDDNDFIFYSETEVSNRMFAAYLSETNQIRDDSELEKTTQKRTGIFSTAAPVTDISDRTALWRNGKMPEDREDHPVSFITTHQAMNFCNWLNDRYDIPGVFRLPTEEEWLFAAYGNDREFPWGDDKKKWIGKSTEPVNAHPELRTPDGLCGMWGNVSELILSNSDGYGGQIKDKYDPWICQWLGTSFKEEVIQGAQPRQDYWGYTHSLSSRSDEWGFRFVFVPNTKATSNDGSSTEVMP
jgi:formylglycine-generating enzyme required for sulfatase activity